MAEKETKITELEGGRAEFAYNCVKGLINLTFEVEKFPRSSNWVEQFKKKVKNSLKKGIEDNKITAERIDEILLNPVGYTGSMKKILGEEERKIIDIYEKVLQNYRSYVLKIPQMILSSGLGQTLAFIYSKKENGNSYDLIYEQLMDYLKSNSAARIKMPEDKNELVEWVISLPSIEYRYVTEEVLAFLNWLRRFAEGMIETGLEEE